jgi:hypothetical protein
MAESDSEREVRARDLAIQRALLDREVDTNIKGLQLNAQTVNGHILELTTRIEAVEKLVAKLVAQNETQEEIEKAKSEQLTDIRRNQLDKRSLYLPLAFMILCVFVAAGLSHIRF